LKNYKPILIVAGEPNSIFVEILIKSMKRIKIKSPIILIISIKLFKLQMKKLKSRYPYRVINEKNILKTKLDKDKINIIDINYDSKKTFEKISSKSKGYINKCFNLALKLIKNKLTDKLINGPVSKKYFLKKEFLGVTEFLAKKTNSKNYAMLIYNKNLSVSPITTHLPIKLICKKISKQLIIEKTNLINNFFKQRLNIKPKIAITGINPHCESTDIFDEDKKVVKPAINYLKNKIDITGPLAADTIFLKNNRKNYNVIIGMYHDQVLAPIKTLFEYDAINITLGLPFLRVSPDHGPNEKMIGKNLSNPLSLIRAMEFLDR